MTNWNELATEIHALACEKGWWPSKEPADFERAALMIGCEIAEMVEEYRRAESDESLRHVSLLCCEDSETIHKPNDPYLLKQAVAGYKPEGFAIELADIVIRTLDLCAAMGWEIHSRVDVVHSEDAIGFSFVRLALRLQVYAVNSQSFSSQAMDCVHLCAIVANKYNIDLPAVIRLKHEYNKTRPYRHGGMRL